MHRYQGRPRLPKTGRLVRAFTFLIILFCAIPVQADRNDLRIALLPIIDSFPYHVAQAEQLFTKAGINVNGLAVSSAVNRDQLMQAGEIDGMLNELMTTANFNRRESRVKIVSVVRVADQSHPLFRILGAPGSTMQQATDLAGIPIGVSRNTIIEYVTDRLLQHAGVPENAVRKQSVPSIPERYQLLLQGRLQAATLPDPLAQSAMASGAVWLIDDRAIAGHSLSVLSFTNQALQEKRPVIKRFLEAWNLAVQHVNTDPEAYLGLLMEKIRIPPNVQTDYRIPPFAYRQLPNRNQWQDVMTWMIARQLLDAPIAFDTCVALDMLGGPGAPPTP